MHIFQNRTTEHVFPITLQTSEFDTKLLQAPKTLKDLVRQHKQNGQMLEKSKNDANKKSLQPHKGALYLKENCILIQ